MSRIFFARAALGCAAVLIAVPCHADDGPLIWKPSKNSDTSYSVKLGLKLPNRIETEAGISMGVNTTQSGAPVDMPVSFWSNFIAQKIKTPASEIKRGIGVGLDEGRGASITMNYYEKEIATPTIDIEKRSSYAMHYDGATGGWAGMDASQSVRLSHPGSGTTLIGRVSGSDGFKTVGAGMGVEQRVGDHMTVTGSLDRYSDADDPVTSVKARYSFTW
ncbi:hypothetical protein [Rhizobium terrae]|uniref:hypothetical protein n=1 Tax=Rhizobium terrae TaxID=2171756 RepID=UPI000E3E3B4B|nr:hypothetical protein [Rhizobium terrae]